MKRILFYCIISLLINSASLFASDGILKDVKADKNIVYVIRLNNGDIITGPVIEYVNDPEDGEGIKVKTEVGNAIIFASQIAEISIKEESYRHNHRNYILPTAEPISGNHFIGIWEMLFAYAGFGIYDVVSITAGRSLIPGIAANQQIMAVNIKATLFSTTFESLNRTFVFALGANYGTVNDANKMEHLYAVGTFKFDKTSLTLGTFFKLGSQDFFTAYFGNNAVNISYPDGSIGIALGMDSKWSTRHDLHIIGEIWNSDVAHPSHTGILLGLRLANTDFAADFGLAFFTLPLAAPFMSFSWTPF